MPSGADDQTLGGEVGTLDALEQCLEQLLVGCLRVVEVPLHAGRDLAQVVRRDVGGHADRDAARAVDEQVGEARRQDRRLLLTPVVVGVEVDRLLVDVAHHLHRERREPALGVAHGGLPVVARRAEVALALHERVAQRPRLAEAHQRVVDRGVAVRVVLTHDVTDDAGALGEAAVGPVAPVVHRVEHATVHRLQPVAHVGQRALHDDAHGVVEIGPLHLDLQVDELDAPAGRNAAGGWSRSQVLSPSGWYGGQGSRRAREPAGALRCQGTARPWHCAG